MWFKKNKLKEKTKLTIAATFYYFSKGVRSEIPNPLRSQKGTPSKIGLSVIIHLRTVDFCGSR